MSTVKSIRLNDRLENMFNSLKKYNSGTDTEIIVHSIERQFEEYSELYNPIYRTRICDYIGANSIAELFSRLCDVLEPMSYSDGFFLEEEVLRFMLTVEADCFFYAMDEIELTSGDFQKYTKIYKVLMKNGEYEEVDFQNIAKHLVEFYEKRK